MQIEHNFKYKNGRKPKITNYLQYLCIKFLKQAESLGKDWPRELKIAKTLLSKYPDETFWRGFSLGYSLNSLAYFLTPEGRNLLEIEYKKSKLSFNNPNNLDISLESSKIGDDFEIKKEIRTIKDFVNS